MKHILLLLLFLSALINSQAQTPSLPLGQIDISSGPFKDYIIPNFVPEISITIVGGSGVGQRSRGLLCVKYGGRGATISASFKVGNYSCSNSEFVLKPGGTLRIIPGKGGQIIFDRGYSNSMGSGGGGSAALYLPPGATNWVILLVAGAGGGASAFDLQDCSTGNEGRDAELGESGGDGVGLNAGHGGSNGNGGFAGGIISGDGGGGGGAFSPGQDGTRSGIGGKAGGNIGGDGGFFKEYDGGFVYQYIGGFGFGGGGAAASSSGGGGGYSGGGGGGNAVQIPGGGGGGGSYVITGAFAVSKTIEGGRPDFISFDGFAKIISTSGQTVVPVSLVSSSLPAIQVLGCSTDDVAKTGLPYSSIVMGITLAQFNAAGGAIASLPNACIAQIFSYQDVLGGLNNNIVTRTFTVTDAGGNPAYGTQVITIENPAFAAIIAPASQSVCINEQPATITLSVVFSQGITVKWLRSSTSSISDATLITGAGSSYYTPPTSSFQQVIYYFARISGSCNTNTVINKRVKVSFVQYIDWVLDKDKDGYYTGNVVRQCTSPGTGYAILSSQLPGDCNDDDAAINPATVWLLDADGDGYHDKLYIAPLGGSCTPPQDGRNYINKTKGEDCDDNDATYNPETVWVIDADGDGYYKGTPYTGCIQFGVFGYVRKTTQQSGDCDDTNAAINPSTIWILDADSDGYYTGNPISQCASPGEGYVIKTTQKPGDCNDKDATINAPVQYYVDADGDGFGSVTTAMLCLSTAPVGYSTNNTDCNDNDPTVHASVQYYVDADKDGYGSTVTAMLCSSTAPVGYSTNNTDCNDNDAAINPATVWILDYDQDGYYSRIFTQCTSPGPGYIIKSTQLPGDCNDNNASVNPGAKEVCGNGIDDNCNGFIDESICYPCLIATNLQTISITATSAQLNWTAVANAVQWQVEYKTTKQGSKWVDLFLTGNKRSLILTGLLSNQNYLWHIRAKCGNNWTDYSNGAKFITGLSNALSSVAQTQTADEKVIEPGLRVYPNPSQGQFMVEMQLPEKNNSIVNIQVIDLTGQVLQTETASMLQGYLKKNMKLNAALAKGMYTLRIITGNKTYNIVILREK